MSSKQWIEKAIKKPASAKKQGERTGEPDDASGKTSRRARLAELLLKTRNEKG
jgi:hypothetical protein